MTACAELHPIDFPTRSAASASAHARYRTASWCVIGILCLGSIAGRLSYIFEPFGTDSSMFIYMGKLVTAGGRVGVELVDNKFPTVGLMTSGAWRLLGPRWPGYVILQTLMAIIAAGALARSVGRNIGAQALVPTALCALVYFNFSLAVGGGFQLETIQAFFATLAASAALNALCEDHAADSFLVGLAAATAMMFKPSSVAVLVAFALGILARWGRRPARVAAHAISTLAGAALPAAASLVYLIAADLLKDLPAIWRQIASYAANSRLEWWDLGKWIVVVAIGGFPFLVRGVIFRGARDRASIRLSLPLLIFGLSWLVIEAGGVIAQKRMYPYHFFVLAPPIALLFGMLPRGDRLLPLLAALALPLFLSLYGGWRLASAYHPRMDRLATSRWFDAHAIAGDRVWQDYLMRLMVETDLQPGSRYFTTFLWANDDRAAACYSEAILRDFRERQPRYVVLPTELDRYIRKICDQVRELELNPRRRMNYVAAWGTLRSYIVAHYRVEAQVGRETIFRRISENQDGRLPTLRAVLAPVSGDDPFRRTEGQGPGERDL